MTAVGDVIPAGTPTPDDVTGVTVHPYPVPLRRSTGGTWTDGHGGHVAWQWLHARECTVTRLVGMYDRDQVLTGTDPEPCVDTVVGLFAPEGRIVGVWGHLSADPDGWCEVGTSQPWTWGEITDTGDVVVLYAPHHGLVSGVTA